MGVCGRVQKIFLGLQVTQGRHARWARDDVLLCLMLDSRFARLGQSAVLLTGNATTQPRRGG
mgnify:CR=1 FL=1